MEAGASDQSKGAQVYRLESVLIPEDFYVSNGHWNYCGADRIIL